jgi:ribonuclease HI
MELLLEAGAEAVGIFGDSKLVISQLTEEYRCKSNLLFRYGYNVKSLWPNLGT